MKIAMFFIFLVCNLIIVPLCQYSYGKLWEYREGMVLGVHIPATCVQHPRVRELCERHKKSWILFHRINLAASFLICFVCFLDYMAFLIVWMLWLLEYVCGLEYLIIVPHRRMYRLKMENGWMDERSRKIVRIDTAVSAASQKLSLDWKWHLPILVLTVATAYFVAAAERKFQVDTPEAWPFWLLYGTGVGLCLLFLAMHVGVERRPNRVYSEDSQINLAANQLTKRSWTEGLVYASWANGVSWIFMAIAYYRYGPDIPGAVYAIYTGLIFLAVAALLLPLGLSVGKRREVLEADTSACCIDDDEYWKKGWYNNPGDRHLLVQDRFNSMNMSMNYGRPAAKVITGVLAAVILGGLVWTAVLLSDFVNVEVVFTQEGDTFTFEAAGYDCSFDRARIRSVELLDSMPEENFTRTNGGSTEEYHVGYFRGKETGRCMMFLYTGCEPILEIQLDDMTVFANSRQEETTLSWYEELAGQVIGE